MCKECESYAGSTDLEPLEAWLRELYLQVRAVRIMLATGFFLGVLLVVGMLLLGVFS